MVPDKHGASEGAQVHGAPSWSKKTTEGPERQGTEETVKRSGLLGANCQRNFDYCDHLTAHGAVTVVDVVQKAPL